MLKEKLLSTIRRFDLIKKGDRVLVAVSGGADSVCLFYLLCGLKDELGLKLHVAHLDHGLRSTSAKDREFVAKLAAKLKVPFTWSKVNIRRLAKKGSVEEICRQQRYQFLVSCGRRIKADKIAVAHNLDDQAETVLMRIIRGTGLLGLCGILPKRNISGAIVIRPLIGIKRKEIESFLKAREIPFRTDKSNFEDIYLRNRVRNELLPFLEKRFNTNIKESLCNMAESAGMDYDYLVAAAQRAARGLGSGGLNLKKVAGLHPSLRRLILRKSIERVKGDTRRLELRHIREIEDLILNRPAGSIVHLPAGISVVKKKTKKNLDKLIFVGYI